MKESLDLSSCVHIVVAMQEHSDIWIAMFSHTGSEIARIAQSTGRWPDKIVIDWHYICKHNIKIHDGIAQKIVHTPEILVDINCRQMTVEQYNLAFNRNVESLVTLHGWMKIVPKSIVQSYNIINYHPGLITRYPELKGQDPQKHVVHNIMHNNHQYYGGVYYYIDQYVDNANDDNIIARWEKHISPTTVQILSSGLDKADEILQYDMKEQALDGWIYILNKQLFNQDKDNNTQQQTTWTAIN